MIILGIETSCDETAASIFKNDTLLSSIIFSQIKIHKKFGGVVPEIASRNHLEKINLIIEKAVKDAKIKFEDIDLISVANQPGLIGSLIIGSAAAKALSYTLNIPLKTVNHIKAHIFANFIEHKGLKPPFLSLVISGGHSFLAKVNTDLSIEKIGKTRDDAIGEAYDKIARILGLPYPGGPNLEKISQTGDENFIFFKRSLIDEDNFDF
ncbi:MAG: tRNA (adenosine(37)-N6)-threonylcarbamoyltransferase complex transferase subunit TsaD, partial [Clostridiales Family XIII bacterium]|nr:tRNA (adenosine(37)-N6)-threonylcarbamoyltransferase complex transferase subunit TsaD [Clostridiales Family XIII bacterium]